PLLRHLAAAGNPRAQFHVGALYVSGHGVPQDFAEALKWFLPAAAQGDAQAQFSLAIMYGAGQGVTQDYVEAYKWSTLAAANLPPGEEREGAVYNRKLVAARMAPSQIVLAERLAREWKPTLQGPAR
ncbi:MAG TPA: hypothetical protein VMQ51_21195, partial [Candidatus Binatia bacterium]|nr:hypothetical protein [Candidatus Binatia bacterium]